MNTFREDIERGFRNLNFIENNGYLMNSGFRRTTNKYFYLSSLILSLVKQAIRSKVGFALNINDLYALLEDYLRFSEGLVDLKIPQAFCDNINVLVHWIALENSEEKDIDFCYKYPILLHYAEQYRDVLLNDKEETPYVSGIKIKTPEDLKAENREIINRFL